MFEASSEPRVFGVAPGIDFPQALISGLCARMQNSEPDEMGRVQVIVNTQRMARRMRVLFDQGPAMILPRIDLLTSFSALPGTLGLAPAVNPLRRRFELIQLLSRLLEQQPDLAPRASLYDLADSLASLMDEMSGEGVSPDQIAALDVSDLSGHWERTQAFFEIARHFLSSVDAAPDKETRQRLTIESLISSWKTNPPKHPIILAGSTGSRGTTLLLMEAIARLPQGALILPGYDFAAPKSVWENLENALIAEDHPQYRFHRIVSRLGLSHDKIRHWHDTPAPNEERNRLVSLALRPAPVTDQWRSEGPKLKGIETACQSVTLLEADSQRIEAQAIAMRLRQAAEDGKTAALITPDRMLSRQVTAALDQWDILPDDSAGTPLQLSPPGRFLKHVAALGLSDLTAESLLTLLKHPLTHSGAERNTHLRHTRDLELHIRRKGWTYPSEQALRAWGIAQKDAQVWSEWLVRCFCIGERGGQTPLAEHLEYHLDLAEKIARGSTATEGTGVLWDAKAGREARHIVEDLRINAGYAGTILLRDYIDLFSAILSRGEVRDRDAPHPKILIWGTLEARVQGADILILGSLNEGSWPESPRPDPWLNRKMRHDAGLLLPERRIGLSAHDFQQAIAAQEVWLTRSIRSDEAETVPSRWINRLTNLLSGLPDQGGVAALADMRARGEKWINRVSTLESFEPKAPAPRPSPRPPVSARPNQLSVTEIKRLIRDPYAIYAKHILRLRPLDPLMKTPDALLRGIVVHEVLERFVKDVTDNPDLLTPEHLNRCAKDILAKEVPWPAARLLWEARLDRIAAHFVASETSRQNSGQPVGFESDARAEIPSLGFTLRGKADRIDRQHDGKLVVYDYKTGKPPTKDEQTYFDKQLLLEAAMAEAGAFREIGPAEVTNAIYIGLGNPPIDEAAPLAENPTAEVWEQFEKLIRSYLEADQGYTARRALRKDSDSGDYDQLARFGEWDVTDAPVPEDLS